MHPFKYHVSLRVHHPDLDPEKIINILGIKAEFKWKAGTKRKTPRGRSLTGVYDSTYCCFELKHSKEVRLVDFLKRYNRKLYKQKDFFETIRSTGGKLEYFIGWFFDKDSGEIFDLELLKQLVELGIDLSLSVYGADIKTSRSSPGK